MTRAPASSKRHCSFSRKSMGTLLMPALLVLSSFLFGCRVTWQANGEPASDGSLRGPVRIVHIPSAVDQTAHGGLAARLTQALYLEALKNLQLRLAPIDEARVAIDVQIEDVSWSVVKISECDNRSETAASSRVGSQAYGCKTISYSVEQAEVTSEQETLTVRVTAKGIDLATGQSIFRQTLTVGSGAFDVVGDSTVTGNLKDRPEFHAIRYIDNRDRARQIVAQSLGTQITGLILAARWPR